MPAQFPLLNRNCRGLPTRRRRGGCTGAGRRSRHAHLSPVVVPRSASFLLDLDPAAVARGDRSCAYPCGRPGHSRVDRAGQAQVLPAADRVGYAAGRSTCFCRRALAWARHEPGAPRGWWSQARFSSSPDDRNHLGPHRRSDPVDRLRRRRQSPRRAARRPVEDLGATAAIGACDELRSRLTSLQTALQHIGAGSATCIRATSRPTRTLSSTSIPSPRRRPVFPPRSA